MDSVNIQPFKEPRGVIKLLQWLFAICAFATTVSYTGHHGFNVSCNTTITGKALAEVTYPFGMDHENFVINGAAAACPGASEIPRIGNAQSESVFFVFTGVISFLYATGLIFLHLFADNMYLSNKRITLGDFGVTIFLAVFWIAGASAWAHGKSSVSESMQDTDVVSAYCKAKGLDCSNFFYESTKKLTISVLFGFINFVLWAGNIWFLYKETAVLINGGMGSPSPQITSEGRQGEI